VRHAGREPTEHIRHLIRNRRTHGRPPRLPGSRVIVSCHAILVNSPWFAWEQAACCRGLRGGAARDLASGARRLRPRSRRRQGSTPVRAETRSGSGQRLASPVGGLPPRRPGIRPNAKPVSSLWRMAVAERHSHSRD
jgi:hypothetical protein